LYGKYAAANLYTLIFTVLEPIYVVKGLVLCVMVYIAQRTFDVSGWKMFNRVLREFQEPDLGAGGRLAAIGCVYWRPAPIGATG
jgi:hypothetical protein